MTTAPSVTPSLSPLHSERAPPLPRYSARTGAGVAFPARPHGPLLRLRSPVMSAGGVGVNGSPVAPEDSAVSSRLGEVKRVTKVTNVHVKVNLDGTGVADCSTGIPFLDHMLDLKRCSVKVVVLLQDQKLDARPPGVVIGGNRWTISCYISVATLGVRNGLPSCCSQGLFILPPQA
ncbi:hypothetical protein ACQJBY_019159 [Aegilops geniculata]